ncbi:MAG: alpha/beta hydrolase [Rickettsiaceae bacterium]|nr:alpha/beta hydrolase [Rickettsiaceae bacterium]
MQQTPIDNFDSGSDYSPFLNLSRSFLLIMLLGFLVLPILTACNHSRYSRSSLTTRKAEQAGFVKRLVSTEKFNITTYQKITSKKGSIVFYIEGDGRIFYPNGVISNDPTPQNLMVMRLAVSDPRPNVVYIARPCQFTPVEDEPNCSNIYWTDKRLAPEAVASINEVIEKVSNNNLVDLVGFSGGGGIATLIPLHNKRIRSIITIGGNLDHVAFNKYHAKRPMIGSLNPIDYAHQFNQIPQLHLSGGMDRRVPPFIADDYVKAAQNPKCVRSRIIPDATHMHNWEKYWVEIAVSDVKCY